MGDPTSSYTTAGKALRVIWPCKPYHYMKVGINMEGHPRILLAEFLSYGTYKNKKLLMCPQPLQSNKVCL